MTLVKCGPDTVINAAQIRTIEWDRGHTYTAMIVTMSDGHAVRLRHEPNSMAGTDCFLIEAKLLDASRHAAVG